MLKKISINLSILIINLITSSTSFANTLASEKIIERIICEGNKQISCDFIKNKLFQKEGDKLNEDEISDAKLRLSNLNHIKDVNIFFKKNKHQDHITVIIKINEATEIQYELNIGTELGKLKEFPGIKSTNHNSGGRITNYNFLGMGKILDSNIFLNQSKHSYANRKNKSVIGNLRYRDPHLLGSKRFFLGTGIKYTNYTYSYKYNYVYDQPEIFHKTRSSNFLT